MNSEKRLEELNARIALLNEAIEGASKAERALVEYFDRYLLMRTELKSSDGQTLANAWDKIAKTKDEITTVACEVLHKAERIRYEQRMQKAEVE